MDLLAGNEMAGNSGPRDDHVRGNEEKSNLYDPLPKKKKQTQFENCDFSK